MASEQGECIHIVQRPLDTGKTLATDRSSNFTTQILLHKSISFRCNRMGNTWNGFFKSKSIRLSNWKPLMNDWFCNFGLKFSMIVPWTNFKMERRRKAMTEILRKILQNYMSLNGVQNGNHFSLKIVSIQQQLKWHTHESRLWFSFYWHKVCNDKYFPCTSLTVCQFVIYKIQRIKTAAEWHSLSIDKRQYSTA